jgi:plasmid stabilization system protein ParE
VGGRTRRNSSQPVTYQLIVEPGAESDFSAAARWYERQRPGLGSAFIQQIDRLFDRVRTNPTQYQIIYRDVRRAVARGFPYGVIYRVDGFEIRVAHEQPGETMMGRIVCR